MTQPIDVTGWIPNLLGPIDLMVNGVLVRLPRRSTINLIGASIADNQAFDRTDITFPVDLTGVVIGVLPAANGGSAAGSLLFYGYGSEPLTIGPSALVPIANSPIDTTAGGFDGSIFTLPPGRFLVTADLAIVHSAGTPATLNLAISVFSGNGGFGSMITSDGAGVADGSIVRVSRTILVDAGDARSLFIQNIGDVDAHLDGGIGPSVVLTIVRVA